MADEGVPSDEMLWMSSYPDPIDAVLSGDPLDEDLLDVAAIVHDIRSTYLRGEPLRRRSALAAFTETHLDADCDWTLTPGGGVLPASTAGPASDAIAERTGRNRNKMMRTVSGFVGTVTGKVLIGAAVAAASVGGLQAADVMSAPDQSDEDEVVIEEASESDDDNGQTTLPEVAVQGQETAAEKHAGAEGYTSAVRDWTACVAAAAAGQGDAQTRTTGSFDPRSGCGTHPEPGDFGLLDLPSEASDGAGGGVEGTPGEANVPDAAGGNDDADEGSGGGDDDATDGGANAPVDIPGGGGADTPGGGRP